jgi:hypothetical protein
MSNDKIQSSNQGQMTKTEDRKTGMLEYWNNGVKNEGAAIGNAKCQSSKAK